jgi:hypothetical protein
MAGFFILQSISVTTGRADAVWAQELAEEG